MATHVQVKRTETERGAGKAGRMILGMESYLLTGD